MGELVPGPAMRLTDAKMHVDGGIARCAHEVLVYTVGDMLVRGHPGPSWTAQSQ